jgi:4-hydroxybenzoyl-CoA reductase subunit beta
MMRLPPFTYLAPVSVGDAVKLMADHGPEAMLVAGGTDLYPNMKRRQFEPSVLVGLRGIRDLAGVSGSAKAGVTIGAGTTLTACPHPEIAATTRGWRRPPGSCRARSSNVGTLGSNICLDTRCNYNQSTSGGRPSFAKRTADLSSLGSRLCSDVSSDAARRSGRV